MVKDCELDHVRFKSKNGNARTTERIIWKEAVGRKHHFLLCIGKFTGFYMPSNSFLQNRVHELTGGNGTIIVRIFKYVEDFRTGF